MTPTTASALNRLVLALDDLERIDRTYGFSDDPYFWNAIRSSYKRLECILLGQTPLEVEDVELLS